MSTELLNSNWVVLLKTIMNHFASIGLAFSVHTPFVLILILKIAKVLPLYKIKEHINVLTVDQFQYYLFSLRKV